MGKRVEKKIKERLSLFEIILITIVIIAIGIVISFCLWGKYNPKDDVCLELVACQIDFNKGTFAVYSNKEQIGGFIDLNIGNKIGLMGDDYDKAFKLMNKMLKERRSLGAYCKEWRPKTLCEKCVDWNWNTKCDKECACDEWGKYHYYCVKAHQKSECEKENSNYILDAKCPKENIYLSQELCNNKPCNILCSSGWVEFCREKTIEDLTCEELEKGWIESKICFDYTHLLFGCDKYYTREEIEHKQLIKGCFN